MGISGNRWTLSFPLFWFVFAVIYPPVAISETVQIRFGTFDLAPYGFYDGTNDRRGMLRDMNSAVATRAGLSHSDRVMPLKRLHKEQAKGNLACSTFIPLAQTRRDLIQVAEITANLNSIVIPKKGLSVSKLEDLHGLTIALPRGSYAGMAIQTDPKINRLLTNGYDQSAAILKAGRVDAMAGSDIAVYHSLAAARVPKSEIGQPFVFLRSSLWLQCRKDTKPSYIKIMRAAARQLRTEGVFKNIKAQYAPGYTE